MAERKLTSKVLTWRASIAESGLPRTTRAVAWALANHMNERGESAFPGTRTLAIEVGNEKGSGPASPITVVNALKQLQEAGYLVRVKQGGGRARKGEWHAQIPESVQQVNSLSAAEGSGSGSDAGAADGDVAASDEGRDGVVAAPKTVQQVNSFGAAETVQLQRETIQSGAVKCSATEHEVELLEVDQEVEQQQPRAREADEAAAAALESRLKELKIVGAEREQALADPERATAWLDLVDAEAKRNPAGMFSKGFATGDWPSPRINATSGQYVQSFEAKKRWISWLFEVDDVGDPDELRYCIDVDWDWLTSVERSELHEHLDEMLSGPPIARPELRAVDAA